jgi:hypothetical protein
MKTALCSLLAFITASAALQAADTAEAATDGSFEAPKKYGPERYSAGWERNPFSIPTPPTQPPPVESEFKDLAVKSYYGPTNSPTFSIVNTKTHERQTVSMIKESKQGLKLVSFRLGDSRKEVEIEVSKGSETGTLRYAADYVPPAGGLPQGIAAGQQRPGMQGLPGMPGVIPRPAGITPQGVNPSLPAPAINSQRNVPSGMQNAGAGTPINRNTGSPIVIGGGSAAAPVPTNNTNNPTINIGADGNINIGTTPTPTTNQQQGTSPDAAPPRRRTLIPAPGLPSGPGHTTLPGSTPN